MDHAGLMDDQTMRQYRDLLDAEDEAFDELEHAYEDGDRDQFETEFNAWQEALHRKLSFLERQGIQVTPMLDILASPETV